MDKFNNAQNSSDDPRHIPTTSERMERVHYAVDDKIARASIAISLKRIADLLEEHNKLTRQVVQASAIDER